MGNFTLLLLADSKEKVELPLQETNPQYNVKDLILAKQNCIVYSNLRYSAFLSCPDGFDEILKIKVFLNNIEIPVSIQKEYNGFIIQFLDNNLSNFIFMDCYGFVQFLVYLETSCNCINLYSDYAVVYLKANQDNYTICKMAEYVYNNHEKYLYEFSKPHYITGLKEELNNDLLFIKLKLLKKIINIYDDSYSYFKFNSKVKIIEKGYIDRFEKLNIISVPTLEFIAQHPEELYPAISEKGIKFKRQYYQPKNTLVMNKIISYNIYENKVLVGFLNYLINYTSDLQEKINKFIDGIKQPQINGYISSISYIYNTTKMQLTNRLQEIDFYKEHLKRIYVLYKQIFNVNDELIYCVPKQTAIFQSIPKYNIIFNGIKDWFSLGAYDLSKEEFLLPIIVNHKLYEYYALLKLINCLVLQGFTNTQNYKFNYKVSNNAKYKNTLYNNTFEFVKGDIAIKLYFQPVIFGDKFNSIDNNGVNLYRATSLTMASVNFDDRESSGKGYYAPDYIIKIITPEKINYCILDAKFSTFKIVKNQYYSNLVFKYLFSVNAVKGEKLIGLCALCGKGYVDRSLLENVKDIEEKVLKIRSLPPYADIILLTEFDNVDDNTHSKVLMELLKKYF